MLRRLRQVAIFGLALAFVLTVGAAGADPRGNNGTVKVDGEAFDSHQDNEPHPGCVFEIDFYGFDQGNLTATVTFDGWPPTGGGTLLSDTVFIGEDPAGGGGDLDASKAYDLRGPLTGITPHPKQGYHVKLTVHAQGSIGADVKHKVFWVLCHPPGGGGGGGGGGGNPPGGSNPPATPAKPVNREPSFTG